MTKAEKVIKLAESISENANPNEIAKKILGSLYKHPQNTILHGDIVRKASSIPAEIIGKIMLKLESHGFVSRSRDDKTPHTHTPKLWVINKQKIASVKRN